MSIALDNDTTLDNDVLGKPGVPLMTNEKLGETAQPVRDTDGTDSALALGTGSAVVGHAAPARFSVNAGYQGPEGDAPRVAVGGNGKLLGFGNHETWSWIQSYNGRPLRLNPVANDVIVGVDAKGPAGVKVGIRTATPQAELDVNGATRTGSLEVTGSFALKGVKQIASAPVTARLRSLAIDPETGTLYYV
jgi:hypothetical protein